MAMSSCTGHVEHFIREESELDSYGKYKEAIYFDYSRQKPAPRVESQPRAVDTKIVVVDKDCVDVGIELAMTYGGAHVGVLNMANEWNCGGGFDRTGGSQEEYLFRRTSCAVSLWPHRRADDHRWTMGCKLLGHEQPFYQFSEAGGILTPAVAVISDGNLKYVERKARMSNAAKFPDLGMVSIAAQDLRARHYNKGVVFDIELTKEKFRTALSISLQAGHKALVLGAIGCGAFRNPPQHVAAIWMDLLTTEFRNQFEEVHFAIILSANNLSVFQQTVRAALARAPAQASAPSKSAPNSSQELLAPTSDQSEAADSKTAKQ